MALGASNWIKLNVGGQPFQTTLTTLLSCPGSFLSKMFDPESGLEPAHKENGVYFIDTDPEYFGIILNWMRLRKIIAKTEINLNNVAAFADYFGIVELVEEIKKLQNPPAPQLLIIGKWVARNDVPAQNRVPAMAMILIPNYVQVRIVQFSNGLGLDTVSDRGKHLSLDLEGRSAVWVQTTTGIVPPEAISVKGEGGRRMFIGRRLWMAEGPNNATAVTIQVFDYEDGDMFIPMHAHISLGYVNEKGIWSINFSKSVKDTITDYHGPEMVEEDDERRDCTSSEFEILCIF